MRRFFLSTLIIAGLVCISAAYILWGKGGVLAPGEHDQARVVIVPRHSGVMVISRVLSEAGVIKYPWSFLIAATLMGKASALKPGEYSMPAGATPAEIAQKIVNGQTVTHTLTIPEGYSVHQVIQLIQNTPQLEGDVGALPPEGSLLPESYHFKLWDKRINLIQRMKGAMDRALHECWQARNPDLPLQSPEELLTLASIVEKETGVATERSHIAGVFVNRLAKGIRLQADPTVIYGITGGQGALGRKLLRKDVMAPTPYNTYTNVGLPPTPIACPGKAALKATAQPKQTRHLYFVADGTGGHTFSESLKEHTIKVQAWRSIRAQREQENRASEAKETQQETKASSK